MFAKSLLKNLNLKHLNLLGFAEISEILDLQKSSRILFVGNHSQNHLNLSFEKSCLKLFSVKWLKYPNVRIADNCFTWP